MYLCWKLHHIEPSVFFNIKNGEKKILRAFIEKEIEDRNKELSFDTGGVF